MRIADDRLVSGARFASISAMIDAIGLRCFAAMSRNATINSGSSDILV